jgi:hypothetical protein
VLRRLVVAQGVGIPVSFWISPAVVNCRLDPVREAPQPTPCRQASRQLRELVRDAHRAPRIAAFVLRVTMVKSYEVETDVRVAIGQVQQAGLFASNSREPRVRTARITTASTAASKSPCATASSSHRMQPE